MLQRGRSIEEMTARIEFFHGAGDHDAVRDLALSLARSAAQTAEQVGELREIHEKLNAKCDSLMAHEHYSVVITNVVQNGRLEVDVAGLANTRVRLAVDPEVDPEKLVAGAIGLVARERNCLIDVIEDRGQWKDVGQFERYLDPRSRILLKDRESLIAVDMAASLADTPLEKGDLIGFDRDVAGLAYERLDAPKGDYLFDEDVTDDFAELGGLEGPIDYIKQLIDFRFLYPALAAKYGLRSKCGILLAGAPGNGKTRIARCCAGYLRRQFPGRSCRYMHISGASDNSKWFGDTEQKIIERFRAVRAAAADGPVMMFWDEIDAMARRRGTDLSSGAPDRILNTLLSQIDGVVPLKNTLLLFATNRIDTLDPSLLRPGRIDVKIEIPVPNRRAAAAILRCYLERGIPLQTDADTCIASLLSRLFAPNGAYALVAHVKLSDGRRLPVAGRELVSGAMFENLVQVAAQQAAQREASLGVEGVTEEDLLVALEAELASAVSLLAPGNVKNYIPSVPQDVQPIAVERVLMSAAAPFNRTR